MGRCNCDEIVLNCIHGGEQLGEPDEMSKISKNQFVKSPENLALYQRVIELIEKL